MVVGNNEFYEIPVDEIYLLNLIFNMEVCHAGKANTYIQLIARGRDVDLKRDELSKLSDGIFYLNMFRVGVDDNEYVHRIKEMAMCSCDFSEDDLNVPAVEDPILLENGDLILTETGIRYLKKEI